MANRPREVGTRYENETLALLQKIWPDAHRTSAGSFSHDITGLPIIVECKHRKTWAIRDWVRKCRTHEPFRWAIFAGDGDRRLADSVGDVMVVDRAFGLELLECWDALTWTRKEDD